MTRPNAWGRLQTLLSAEARHLVTVNASERRWQMPFAAALASGLPVLIGASLGQMAYGLVSSLGGLVFLYLPNTPMSHRMVSLMACAFGMIACYTLGLFSHFFPPLMIPMLMFITILVTMVCRFYALERPGSLIFVMAAAIGAYSPIEPMQLPQQVGLLSLGCLLACIIGFFYSVAVLRLQPAKPAQPLPQPRFGYVVIDSVLIGVFVGISLALAQLLHLQRPYWVPISCIAVLQGQSMRAVWNRQLHRVLGTGIGLLLAWGLLLLPLNKWSIPLTMMALTFVIEMAVVRHYGFAAIFMTPMTILLVEAASLGQGSASALIEARFFDTVLGCLVGLAGGVCLHSPRLRAMAARRLRRLIPART
jgi:hypothetical protein